MGCYIRVGSLGMDLDIPLPPTQKCKEDGNIGMSLHASCTMLFSFTKITKFLHELSKE